MDQYTNVQGCGIKIHLQTGHDKIGRETFTFFNQTHSTASYLIIIHWVDYSLVLFKAHGGVCREQCDTIIKFLGTNHTSLFLTKYSKYLTFQCFDITNIKQSTYEMAQKYCSKAKHKSNFLSDICLKTLLIFSITKSKKILTHQKCHQATLKASQAVLPDKDKKRINIP